jgi:cell division protein FtsQ
MLRTLTLLWRLTLPSLRRQPPAPTPGMRRDPAPTLWSYRYQRLMLTPAYRRLVRLGLPVAASLVAGSLWIAQEGNRALVVDTWTAALDRVQERPEFMVASLEVVGADRALAEAVRDLVPLRSPVSSFDLDLEAIRAEVATLTAVREVRVRVRPADAPAEAESAEGARTGEVPEHAPDAPEDAPGSVLEVAVVQRAPVAVWRHVDGLRLIDAEGVMTGMIASRGDRADLPLIAGDGARDAIGEALALFAAGAPIAPRVRGLVRMGERRWDVVLDRDQRILLPTDGAVPALERVVALHQAQELLDRDVSVVDMRLGERPTIRLGQPALNVLRNLNAVAAETLGAPAGPIPEEP